MTAFTYKTLAGAGTALALSFGIAAAQASPVPVFTADPAAFGSGRAPFQGSFMSGDSSSLLTLNRATQTVEGSGYANFTNFSNNGKQLSAGTTGIGVDYTMWVTFNYTTSLTSGTFGAAGSDYTVTSLTYTLWGAQGDWANDFVPVDFVTGAAPIAAAPAGALNLGGGSLIKGSAEFTADGGAAFNSVASYEISADGEKFFIDPRPFYNLAFNEFNNTLQGLVPIGENQIGLVSSSGGVDFNTGTVPEPVSLALFGLGLVGIGAVTRRRKA